MCTTDDWPTASGREHYRPDSFAADGFVHLSTPGQVELPANRLFHGRDDVLLLVLDPDLLDAPLRWEPGVPTDPAAMRFPHLYGPIPVCAVRRAVPYRRDAGGRFGTPRL
ncbi:DUF952 domain-containing protein [Rhodococcus sp. D2-41]|uniref:DUF952 domain-containing protein n=1 Tax=Speluncibacter jeojiensis TaxID=2710754 RepID=UPI00240F718F|nr:DUF952 domain-containing protein [Rhodococcus sp. D2-41]MDG3011409.1 DUF952 domain-containing protein [Rhodococcus sp. D2-41]